MSRFVFLIFNFNFLFCTLLYYSRLFLTVFSINIVICNVLVPCYLVHECMFVLTPQHYEFLVLATW